MRDVTRTIRCHVANMLWGRAAGRCQFDNCNRVLSRAPATQATRNIGEKAHIYAFSLGGPRADGVWPSELLNDIDNLMLVCHDCHVIIDQGDGPDVYTAARLQDMKRRQEQRIEIATSIAPTMSSHVLTYGTFIGEHPALPTFRDAAAALFPRRVPATTEILSLGSPTGSQRDHNEAFWAEQQRELRYEFKRQVRVPIERGDIKHVSVFAMAPQPLLIQLGALLGSITPTDVYQRHRVSESWAWPPDAVATPILSFAAPAGPRVPALVLSVSAIITADRIHRVLGDDVAVWTISVPDPHSDVVKSPAMVVEFWQHVRRLLDDIKVQHGHKTPLHVFPALPVSLAVELGRVRMPKADPPWILYDELQSRGGFVAAFTLTAEADA
ncbi:MAG TPA: SAVED domain-containing protein [Polyangiaceae bacterium]|nr:SAVED domain-containing protein [Polyangiaceae bacterium]